jgi:hypothetical protein
MACRRCKEEVTPDLIRNGGCDKEMCPVSEAIQRVRRSAANPRAGTAPVPMVNAQLSLMGEYLTEAQISGAFTEGEESPSERAAREQNPTADQEPSGDAQVGYIPGASKR